MNRLFLTIVIMAYLCNCELDIPQNHDVQLASFNSESRTIIPVPGDITDSDSGTTLCIAVFHFENRTGDPALNWLENGLSGMFETQLENTSDVEIVDMIALTEAASLLKYKSDDLHQISAALETAKKVHADLLITGNFYQDSDSLYIDVLLKNIHTGVDLCSETVKGHGMEQLLAMIDTISERIRMTLPKEIKSRR